MKDGIKLLPLRVALTYLIAAGLWILFSDRLIALFFTEPEALLRAQTYKGLAFVLVTGTVLYFDLRTRMLALEKEKENTAQAQLALRQSELNYRNMIYYSPLAKFVNQEGKVVLVNPACVALFKAAAEEELLGKDPLELFAPEFHEMILKRMTALKQIGQSVETIEEKIRCLDGSLVPVAVSATLFPFGEKNAVHVILQDIRALVKARDKVEQQLAHLRGLRKIDQAILGSLDLDIIMSIILEQTREMLQVDAAAITLGDSEQVESAAFYYKGFSNAEAARNLMGDKQRLKQIIIQRKHLSMKDLEWDESSGSLLDKEGFTAYNGLPLTAKGQVKGALEVFQRGTTQADEDWLELMETLAGQAAIAADNIQVYDDLRRSLSEVTRAYDSTIVGWSRAMDLRDKETEGHTQRVTEQTLKLARTMGMDEGELVHVRRGALLHDMGKLGIPDSILLKADKLSEQEWEIMRQHPRYAFEMLAPVEYLRPALEIPYCHHEKWDGTGYPRGLKGEQIPLAARIFAVIDVWDALSSERPYRKAWLREKVIEHIRSLAGTHFDPRVVKAFLKMFAADNK